MANKESGQVTLSLVEFPPSSGKDGSLVLESGCAEAINRSAPIVPLHPALDQNQFILGV